LAMLLVLPNGVSVEMLNHADPARKRPVGNL
jgi:hypothetical protein